MPRIIIWLSGEHERLAEGELKGALKAEHARLEGGSGRIRIIEGNNALRVFERMGYARKASLFISSGSMAELAEEVKSAELPEGSFAVRAYRYEDFAGSRLDAEKKLGELISERRKIDLSSPQNTLDIYLGRTMYAGISIPDRRGLSMREPTKRPFFSPVTLSPRMARALINLTAAERGKTILDPFCGTGAILVEAGLMGLIPLGTDIDEAMLEGCKRNMSAYGIEGTVRRTDIEGISGLHGVDFISTDPPYGRSSSTNGEPVESLYKRSLRAISELLNEGSTASIILPDMRFASISGEMELVEHYPVKVHRSLTRNFCVFRKV